MKNDVIVEEVPTVEEGYAIERDKPIPSYNHGIVQANIGFLVKLNYRKKYRVTSEVTLKLENWESVPDISLFPYTPYEATNDKIKTTDVPLCVMEILSPKQNQSELLSKARQYFQKGVKSCWIIFPELENVYIFSSPTDYEIYRKDQQLKDANLDIGFSVSEVFE